MSLPGERHARLVAGFSGANTLALYLVFSGDSEYEQARLGLFIGAGMFAAYGSYLVERSDADG